MGLVGLGLVLGLGLDLWFGLRGMYESGNAQGEYPTLDPDFLKVSTVGLNLICS